MDLQTAAAGPTLLLGIAVAMGILTLGMAAVLALSVRRAPRGSAQAPEPVPPGVYPDDDLPSFREQPPGFPGARPVPAGARRPEPADVAPGRDPVRALLAMALAALVLLTAAAAVAAAARAEPDAGVPARSSGSSATGPPASGTPTAGTSESRASSSVPAMSVPSMSVPASPTSGQAGAGQLAHTSVPVRSEGVTARLTFGGVVLEPRAVGITVTYPRVSVTVADDGTALAHVQLPTWNCMTAEPPEDPAAAGCRRAVPEYADLPTPALQVTRTGDDGLRLQGRFPTYTRPNGTGPVYTGRVYALDITAQPGRTLSDGWTTASGELFLGPGRAESVDDDLSVMRVGD